jgi:NAD(P)-dependent dehydrogenase (short-subunit alcohol dehydrogenase family)
MKANALFDLTGHVVVVTGAASGIGLATSQVVAANGARVVMIDVDGDRLVGAATSVRPTGAGVDTVVVDVRQGGQVAAAIDDYVAKYGRLDCVFANAGISGGPGFGKPDGVLETASPELWNNCLRVNLDGAFHTM